MFEAQKRETADVYAAVVEDVEAEFKALKVASLDKDGARAFLTRLASEAKVPIGTANAVKYEIANSAKAAFTLADLRDEIKVRPGAWRAPHRTAPHTRACKHPPHAPTHARAQGVMFRTVSTPRAAPAPAPAAASGGAVAAAAATLTDD